MKILDKTVERIKQAEIVERLRPSLGDLMDARPPAYVRQMVTCTVGNLADEMKRALYPAVAIHLGSPTREQRWKRLEEMPAMLYETFLMWIFGYVLYMYVNVPMLPDVAHLHFSIILAPSVAIIMGIQLDWTDLAGSPKGRPESISLEMRALELKRKKNLLFMDDFIPSKFPLRSGLLAFGCMMMFFPAGYVVFRWAAGDTLPGNSSWIGLVWRFFTAIVLLALLFCIRKSSKLAAQAFQREIDALDPGEPEPASA